MNLLERLQQAKPTVTLPVKPPVEKSDDLTRILALPRRPPEPSGEHLQAILSRGPVKCECKARFGFCITTLKPVQLWALHEAQQVGGLLAPISVGGGKSFIGILMACVVPHVKVAVLFVPPNLKAQMLQHDYPQLRAHFRVPNLAGARFVEPGLPTLHIVSYSELSNAKASDMLTRIKPDLIICDEVQAVKHRDSARTRRVLRFGAANPDTRLVGMSGTMTSRSIKDYAHIAAWALRDGSPVPHHWPTVEEWADVLDSGATGEPGELLRLGVPVREGFQKRLRETLGVVSTQDSMSGLPSLYLGARDPGALPDVIRDAISGVQETWERPDGEELVDALTKATVCRQLAAGFFFRWRYPRKEPLEVIERWLGVRKAWHKEMREKLKYSREFMDSPLLVSRAARRWEYGYTHEGKEYAPHTRNGPEPTWATENYVTWQQVKDTVEPETEAVWLSDFLVKDAAAWCQNSKGILWYENPEFGRAVAKMAGVTLYGAGEEASEAILKEKGGHSIVASIKAHGTGKNLQHAFSDNLVSQTPSSGQTIEQLLGRTHRQGQNKDEVWARFYLHTDDMRGAFETAKNDAAYVEETTKSRQKILAATWVDE